MSLPLALNIFSEQLIESSSAPYLKAPKDYLEKWQAKLGGGTRPRIGISWRGHPSHHNDWNRSIRLSDFLQLQLPEFQYVSLQKDLAEEDRLLLSEHPEVLHFGDELNDFNDTAAICSLMDFVITVDTSIAHIAGGLGKNTWLLIPKNPDWRWLLDREDSPWYPNTKLIRQETCLNWSSAIEKAKRNLANHFSSK